MTPTPPILRRHSTRLVALALIVGLWGLARLAEATEGERAGLAARFAFVRATLPEVSGPPHRTVRPVHPSLDRISAWISSVGAAVALGDPTATAYRTTSVTSTPAPIRWSSLRRPGPARGSISITTSARWFATTLTSPCQSR